MPASLAVHAHWSVSQPVALKKPTSVTPGVHSLPEKVLNDQQTNMPQRSDFSSSARLVISADSPLAGNDRTADAAMDVNTTI
jgi:hypothetical protein